MKYDKAAGDGFVNGSCLTIAAGHGARTRFGGPGGVFPVRFGVSAFGGISSSNIVVSIVQEELNISETTLLTISSLVRGALGIPSKDLFLPPASCSPDRSVGATQSSGLGA